jgi:hypothetical protein
MAGFWIPWELGLSKKREVMIIARSIGVSRREAAAMCMEVWEWAQEQTLDGLIVRGGGHPWYWRGHGTGRLAPPRRRQRPVPELGTVQLEVRQGTSLGSRTQEA